NGAYSGTFTSPDLVEEVQVNVTSVDAAVGRGSGQVRLQTRSGTNQFHGAAFYSNQNSKLAANNWFQNLVGTPKNYLNRNQFGGRVGGPIVRNKAFFFFLYEGQRSIMRNVITSQVLTDTARQGIYRYFPGVVNGNAAAAVTTGNNPTAPVVDRNGNPKKPAAATGDLVS